MGFYFQMKKSLGILEIDDWKKEYVKKIKLKKNMRTRTIDSSHHVQTKKKEEKTYIIVLWVNMLLLIENIHKYVFD